MFLSLNKAFAAGGVDKVGLLENGCIAGGHRILMVIKDLIGHDFCVMLQAGRRPAGGCARDWMETLLIGD